MNARRTTLVMVALVCSMHAQGSTERARELLDEGRYAEAEEPARQSIAQAERLHGADSAETAIALDLLVESLWRTGESADGEARRLAERAVRLKQAALGSSHPGLADSLDNLGLLLRDTGDYEPAISAFERAVRIRELALGKDHPDVARGLNHMGWAVFKAGHAARAEEIYKRALRIREEAHGPWHQERASTLNNLAIVLKNRGEYGTARRYYEQALEVYERTLGPEHPDFASTLNNLSLLYRDQGDYRAARSGLHRVREIWEKQLGPQHPRYAKVLGNLALLQADMGDRESAVELLELVLDIRKAKLGADDPYLASTLDNLGMLHFEMGNLAQAETLQNEALRIREKVFGPDHEKVAHSLNNLGAIHAERGDFERARPMFERALIIRTKNLGASHPLVASTLRNLAELSHETGSYAEARSYYERSIAIYEIRLGDDHPKVAEALRGLAVLRAELGDAEAALALSLRAEKIGRDHLSLAGTTLSEREALSYASVRPAGQDLALSIVMNGWPATTPGAVRAVWDETIRSRGVVLNEMRARRGHAGDTQLLTDRLVTTSEQLANLLIRGSTMSSPDTYQRHVRTARREREGAERALAEASLSFRRHRDAARIGFGEVSAALPEGASLVAYVRYRRHELRVLGATGPGAGHPDESDRPEPVLSYLAFVLPAPDAEPILIPLGPANELEALVRDWQLAVRAAETGLPGVGAASGASYARSAEALRRAIWDPVAGLVAGSDRALVVPDGVLHLVNFSTLPASEAEYLIETGLRIHYVSAERDLLRTEGSTRESQGLLIAAGPDFGNLEAELRRPASSATRGASCDDFDSRSFVPLHGAADEAETVAAIWARTAAPGERSRVTRLSGPEALEGAFKRLAPGHRVLHIATHGFVLDSSCDSTGARSAAVDFGALEVGDGPATLSGLAFAGANLGHTSRDGATDGILTAEEVAALDLRGVEWVVLSACDTGSGRVLTGEGVMGLRRSFETAGARTIIMSLWSVDDATVQIWMRHLYLARARGLSAADAAWHAGRVLLESRRENGQSTHPYYWGAFVAGGTWR